MVANDAPQLSDSHECLRIRMLEQRLLQELSNDAPQLSARLCQPL